MCSMYCLAWHELLPHGSNGLVWKYKSNAILKRFISNSSRRDTNRAFFRLSTRLFSIVFYVFCFFAAFPAPPPPPPLPPLPSVTASAGPGCACRAYATLGAVQWRAWVLVLGVHLFGAIAGCPVWWCRWWGWRRISEANKNHMEFDTIYFIAYHFVRSKCLL